MPEFSLKVAALVIKQFDDGYRLLVHSFDQDATLPLRFPGGGVDPNEELEEALSRELLEESGVANLSVLRKLGVVQYFKQNSKRFIERHDFLLLADENVEDSWRFEVEGHGEDAGEIFNYRWITQEEFYLIDIELQKFLDERHIPELFLRSLSKDSG